MAAIEFVGYTPVEIEQLKKEMLPVLQDFDFFHHVVWLSHLRQSLVHDLNEGSQRFVRCYTRSHERALILEDKFSYLFPIKIILIGLSVLNEEVFNFSGGT